MPTSLTTSRVQPIGDWRNPASACARRLELRNDPLVAAQLDVWWQAALATFTGASASLSVAQYTTLLAKLTRALYEQASDEDEMAAVAVDDACGEAAFDEDLFKDNVFELADTFSASVSAEAYADVLQNLFSAVAGKDAASFCRPDEQIIFAGIEEPDSDTQALPLPAKERARARNGLESVTAAATAQEEAEASPTAPEMVLEDAEEDAKGIEVEETEVEGKIMRSVQVCTPGRGASASRCQACTHLTQ